MAKLRQLQLGITTTIQYFKNIYCRLNLLLHVYLQHCKIIVLYIKSSELIIQIQYLLIIAKMAEPQYTVVRIAIIGGLRTGKSSLIRREVDNTFDENICNLIGVEFKIKHYSVASTNIKSQIWDTTYVGQKFKLQSTQFFTRCHAIGICFSFDNKKSFEQVDFWLKLARTNPSIRIWMVGCKADLEHSVSHEEIVKYAEQKELIYEQTSAKLNVGCKEVFEQMVAAALQAKLNEGDKNIKIQPLGQPNKEYCSVM